MLFDKKGVKVIQFSFPRCSLELNREGVQADKMKALMVAVGGAESTLLGR